MWVFRISANSACRRSVLCLLAAIVLAGCTNRDQFIPVPGTYDTRILRDEWGVPHIFGAHDADAAYGLAYAECEDDWVEMERAMLLARGTLARVDGTEGAQFDYVVQWFRVREFVDEKYERDLSAEFRKVAEAYAAGITHYAALHPANMPRLSLPVTGKDIVAGAVLKAPFFYSLDSDLETLMAEEKGLPITDKGKVGRAESRGLPYVSDQALGSNGWAVGRAKSADGAVRLMVNSHMPFEGPVTFYQAHVHSGDGWNMDGATFPGGCMLFMGHDENKGWVHTISRPDLADIYKLDINPDNPNQYRFDGAWRDLERKTAKLRVKLWGPIHVIARRELLWSVHGPAWRRADGSVYAIRFAGYGEIRLLEEWFRMNKARNVDEFIEAMRMQAIPSFNTLYADRHGDLFYLYNMMAPQRNGDFDWSGVLPGDTSAAIPQGIVPFDALPQIKNPASAFLQTCNGTPFDASLGADNPNPNDFPGWMGVETHDTNRSLRVLATYGADDSITREEFHAYKYDKRYAPKSDEMRAARELAGADVPDNDPLARQAAEIVRGWDGGMDKDNRAAALTMLAIKTGNTFGNTPVERLHGAAQHLLDLFGTLDVPWSEVMRLRRGALDLPLGGGQDCLRALDPELDPDGRFRAFNGDCLFWFVEWDKDGALTSEVMHQYGAAANDPASPHYADQAPLFAEEKTRPDWFREEDIRAHLKREYRPGEFVGVWYAE